MTRGDERKKGDKAAPEGEGAEAFFGLSFLGTGTRWRIGRNPKGSWALTRRRSFCFLPVGKEDIPLKGYHSICISLYRSPRRYVVELEGSRKSYRLYDGANGDQAN